MPYFHHHQSSLLHFLQECWWFEQILLQLLSSLQFVLYYIRFSLLKIIGVHNLWSCSLLPITVLFFLEHFFFPTKIRVVEHSWFCYATLLPWEHYFHNNFTCHLRAALILMRMCRNLFVLQILVRYSHWYLAFCFPL